MGGNGGQLKDGVFAENALHEYRLIIDISSRTLWHFVNVNGKTNQFVAAPINSSDHMLPKSINWSKWGNNENLEVTCGRNYSAFMSSLIATFFLALFSIHGANAVGTAFGYATAATGGGSATPALPSSTSQLVSWLGDSTTRVILLDKIYDFTDAEGSVTGSVCSPWSCSPNPQQMIETSAGSCKSYTKTSATWKKAATTRIVVGSNKTLLGKGSSGEWKGLSLTNVKNVIIQNIHITDLNPKYVWGGDAISVSGSTDVWINHNYFQNVGRQFIVSHFEANTITISNNIFHGSTTYSTGCDGHHYWVFLFVGKDDKITLAKNYGRGPHIGGTSGYSQLLHAYNNYFVSITGHALDAQTGSKTIFEGNYFNSVKTPVTTDTTGAAYVPTTSTHASSCGTYLSRSCYVNSFLSSGSVSRADIGAVPYFQSTSSVKSASIMDASQVSSYVQSNAGLGK
ncbi:hypothetical protein FRC07_008162, partial [Ceratobasidium sp. 392]